MVEIGGRSGRYGTGAARAAGNEGGEWGAELRTALTMNLEVTGMPRGGQTLPYPSPTVAVPVFLLLPLVPTLARPSPPPTPSPSSSPHPHY